MLLKCNHSVGILRNNMEQNTKKLFHKRLFSMRQKKVYRGKTSPVTDRSIIYIFIS